MSYFPICVHKYSTGAPCLFHFFSPSRFGPRFLATVDTYDAGLRASCKEVFEQLGLSKLMREGTYVMIGGPTFETVAESRLLKAFGGDAVGKNPQYDANVQCKFIKDSQLNARKV